MPEYRRTQTVEKTEEAQQVPFPDRGDQKIVKDAQMQRHVQMIQKMPREIHTDVQTMLMLGSSEAAVQSPGPVLQTWSRRQTSLCSRQVQCCRSRADEFEMRERKRT